MILSLKALDMGGQVLLSGIMGFVSVQFDHGESSN